VLPLFQSKPLFDCLDQSLSELLVSTMDREIRALIAQADQKVSGLALGLKGAALFLEPGFELV
jgi:hypothetical protein